MKLKAGPDDKGLRLDQFLTRHLENVTRSQIQQLNRSGSVHIEGYAEKSGYKIRGGETIEVDPQPAEYPLKAEAIPLPIHYEDDDLAVVEKPAGMVVHPGAGTREGTLVHALLHHFQQLSDFGGEARPGIVHRLDKWTSGLLVVAKNNAAHALLGKAFQDRSVEKRYSALVHGHMKQPSGTIDGAIARHRTIRTRMSIRPDRGRSAHTEYETVQTFRYFTLLSVRIKTGRTHQIRVHLSSLGHPVVGDGIYGKEDSGLGRYFLHAGYLRFAHPVSGEILEFHSPLPEELQNFLGRIRS